MRVLMCPPDYIDIEEEINVHMDKSEKPDQRNARAQWQNLALSYASLGVEIWYLDPEPGLQDMCFSANGGWCRWGKVILSNFAHSIRHREQMLYELWFNRHRRKMLGMDICKIPSHILFEGQGDVVTIDRNGEEPIVLMGYGQGRTDYAAAEEIAKIHGLDPDNVLPMRLINPKFYHLDMASNFISPKSLFVFNPDAFDSTAKRALASLSVELYPVSKADAGRFTCNGVFVERETKEGESDVVYIASNPTKNFVSDMERYGIEVWRRDTSEFHKSGGSNRCLTFFLPEEKSEDISTQEGSNDT